jgi:hypothetical protein
MQAKNYSSTLKVHKLETFVGSDFEFCTFVRKKLISLLSWVGTLFYYTCGRSGG